MLPDALGKRLRARLGNPVQSRAVSGGDINEALRWETSEASYFVKWNSRLGRVAFEAEAAGLGELAAAGHLEVPAVIEAGEAGDAGYLVLEWLDFGPAAAGSWEALGRGLAALHRTRSASAPDCYGFATDNYIGRLPQPNGWTENWPAFWAERRIGSQLRMGVDAGRIDAKLRRRIEKLCERTEELVGDSDGPSLLHGDLWGGNVEFLDGRPCVIDPAVYYGDREVEVAFTELFGGFAPTFYSAYEAEFPLREGYSARKPLWQLYPYLVHLNHFGAGYLGGVERCVSQTEKRLTGS